MVRKPIMVNYGRTLTCPAASSNGKMIVTAQVMAQCNDIVQPLAMRKENGCTGIGIVWNVLYSVLMTNHRECVNWFI